MIIVNGPVYVAPVGADPKDCKAWKLLGTAGTLSVEDGDDFYEEVRDYMSRPLKTSVTYTYRLKMPMLERRAFIRMMFGVESKSLIHNGKKRRK